MSSVTADSSSLLRIRNSLSLQFLELKYQNKYRSIVEAKESRFSDSYNINIKMPPGQIISIQVNGSDTIGSLKLKIEAKEQIPFEEQEVFFNGKVLENINTLAILNITKESTLIVMQKSVELMDIFVNTFTGKTISFSVKPMETIAKVKSIIESKIDVPCDEQALVFNNMILSENATLFDFHINTKSTLTLMRKLRGSMGVMSIFIKTFSGKTITLRVKPLDTIESIKAKIQNVEGISYNEHELIFNQMVLHNEGTLGEFNINKDSTLTLLSHSSGFMRIFIKTVSEGTFPLYVKPSDTIYRLKVMIHSEVGIHPCVQTLFWNRRQLEDRPTLADYLIPSESTIKLNNPFSTGSRHLQRHVYKC